MSQTTASPVIPSVHVRALATWITIFPLVALGMTLMAPISIDWHPVLRALVLTLIVVPLAVYLVVPRILGLYVRSATRRRAARQA
jgi:antibiotic biosynthesis monooxygenase (ABM) superfamily enzyme